MIHRGCCIIKDDYTQFDVIAPGYYLKQCIAIKTTWNNNWKSQRLLCAINKNCNCAQQLAFIRCKKNVLI